jgi:hypothetical protein
LLEEEGNGGPLALVADVYDPGGVHWAGTGAGLASDNHPVDASKVKAGQGTEERLKGEELELGIGPAQVFDPEGAILVFDADAHPDMRSPVQEGVKLQ